MHEMYVASCGFDGIMGFNNGITISKQPCLGPCPLEHDANNANTALECSSMCVHKESRNILSFYSPEPILFFSLLAGRNQAVLEENGLNKDSQQLPGMVLVEYFQFRCTDKKNNGMEGGGG